MQSGGMKAFAGEVFVVDCVFCELFEVVDCCAVMIGDNEQSASPVSSIIEYNCLNIGISVSPDDHEPAIIFWVCISYYA